MAQLISPPDRPGDHLRGLETITRHLKNDERFKSIPVVIHSSLTGGANEDHVKSVGADAYVAKFVADELAETIRNVLKEN